MRTTSGEKSKSNIAPANSIQRTTQQSAAAGAINRKCAHCAEEEQLSRKEAGSDSMSVAPPIVNDALSSSGKSLDNETRSYMEPRFNYDFSQVRVHDNNLAAKSATAINALAYTSGNNIVFNSGQYDTGSDSGKRLLAHELTHVVQQNGSSGNISSKSRDVLQREEADMASLPEEEDLSYDLGGDTITQGGAPSIQRYLIGPPRRVGAAAAGAAPDWRHCREFNYVVNWSTDVRDGYILQECFNADTITRCDGTNVPAPNTPHYWEAWYVDASGAISDGNADTWYRAPRPNTKGRWTFDSNVFTVGSLDPAWGFVRGAVGTAGGLLSTTTGPSHDDLFQPSLTRHFGGVWDCCNGNDTHTPI